MPRKAKLDARGMRSRAFWPKLPDDHQVALLEFLSWYRATAEAGYESSSHLARISDEPGLYLPNANYWLGVIKAIDWLIYHIPHRQEYLEWKQAKADGRLIETTSGPGPSSGPAGSGSPSAPTPSPARESAASPPPTRPSKTRSRKRTGGASRP